MFVAETQVAPDLGALTVRLARPSDKSDLRAAVVELHEEERRLYNSRLPGEETAEAYLVWMLAEASRDGAVFIAEAGGVFAGLAAGWIVQENVVEETPDSNRFGYISDVCVLPAFRGRRIAGRLLDALETRLSASRVKRIRLSALAANKAARASYERSGYAPCEIIYEKAARAPDLLTADPAALQAPDR